MKKKVLSWVFMFLLGFSSQVLADAPPDWKEFDIRSMNQNYVAEVRIKKGEKILSGKAPSYTLSVYEIASGQRKQLWSCDYAHDGYAGGILSEDGSIFAYLVPWYRPAAPVLWVYHRGKVSIKLTGRDFHVDEKKMKVTASHKLWLAQESQPYHFLTQGKKPMALELITIDGKKHILQLPRGPLLR